MTEKDLEGTKHDEEKCRLELVPGDALWEIARVFTHGAEKYDMYNWMGGMKWSRLFGALMRHSWAFWMGEDLDDEWKRHHLAHAGCCLMMLFSHALQGLGEDDRPKIKKPESSEDPMFAAVWEEWEEYLERSEYPEPDPKGRKCQSCGAELLCYPDFSACPHSIAHMKEGLDATRKEEVNAGGDT
jgi:hypothetical protein